MDDPRAYTEGWNNSAEFIGLNPGTMRKYRKELKEKKIAFRWIKGKPPNRRVVIRCWKNLLEAWFIEKFL